MSKQAFYILRELQLMEEIHNGSIHARHDIPEEGTYDGPDVQEKRLLTNLLNNSIFYGVGRENLEKEINQCADYNKYQTLQYLLEANQRPYDQIVNPSATDAKNHVKKIVNG